MIISPVQQFYKDVPKTQHIEGIAALLGLTSHFLTGLTKFANTPDNLNDSSLNKKTAER